MSGRREVGGERAARNWQIEGRNAGNARPVNKKNGGIDLGRTTGTPNFPDEETLAGQKINEAIRSDNSWLRGKRRARCKGDGAREREDR